MKILVVAIVCIIIFSFIRKLSKKKLFSEEKLSSTDMDLLEERVSKEIKKIDEEIEKNSKEFIKFFDTTLTFLIREKEIIEGGSVLYEDILSKLLSTKLGNVEVKLLREMHGTLCDKKKFLQTEKVRLEKELKELLK